MPSRTPAYFLVALVAILLALAAGPSAVQAQQVDVIRGQITGPDSLPVEGATVTATSISGNVSRTARTDRNGRYTITFPGGDGDYMITVSLLGYIPRRFEVKRITDEEILVADARLTTMGALLEDVTVTAQRPRVPRNADAQPDVSGTEQPITNDAVPADLLGDLAAMAATLPGVIGVPGVDGAPDGFSVLGLGADQNNTVLNGMNFGGSSLPRDAAVSSSVVTSPYDVSRGGFSGAQMNLRTRSGSNFVTRGMSLNLDAPPMQWTDRAARARAGILQLLARRRAVRSDPVRQVVLQSLVPARPPVERPVHAAEHRTRRISGGRCRARFGGASARAHAGAGNSVRGRPRGEQPHRRSGRGVRQHRRRAAVFQHRTGAQLLVQRQLESAEPAERTGDGAPLLQRRADELARRDSGEAQRLLPQCHPDRDVARLQPVAHVVESVPRPPGRDGARQLRSRRRHAQPPVAALRR